jgi:hypothetical protein
MAKRKIGVIDNNTINAMNLYAQEVVKRAKRNLKIKKKIEGKYRVTDNTGALAKGLSYKLVKRQNLASGVVEEWINTKPIKLRDLKTNQFISPTEQAKKQASFLIGRSIANKGIAPRHFFKDAIEETKNRFVMDLAQGMIKDTFKTFKDIVE